MTPDIVNGANHAQNALSLGIRKFQTVYLRGSRAW